MCNDEYMKVSNINYSHKVSYDYYLVKYHRYAHNNGATLGCYDYKHFQLEVVIVKTPPRGGYLCYYPRPRQSRGVNNKDILRVQVGFNWLLS